MRYLLAIILTLWVSISFAISIGFSTFVTTLAVADIRQTISATIVNSSDFVIQNPSSNVVSIFLGGSDVTTSGATQGIEIVPGSSVSLSDSFNATNRILSSSKIFIISTGTSIPVGIGVILQ